MPMLEHDADAAGQEITWDRQAVRRSEAVADRAPADVGLEFDSQSRRSSDHFVHCDGISFAGTHLLLDLWGASHLDSQSTLMIGIIRRPLLAGGGCRRVHHKR